MLVYDKLGFIKNLKKPQIVPSQKILGFQSDFKENDYHFQGCYKTKIKMFDYSAAKN